MKSLWRPTWIVCSSASFPLSLTVHSFFRLRDTRLEVNPRNDESVCYEYISLSQVNKLDYPSVVKES